MGFGAIRQPATGGAGTPTAAGLTALVALARADGASAGDLYQDTDTSRYYRYKTGGAGMLVPAEWYPRLGSLKEQTTAGGQAYLTLSDTEADLSARGWTVVTATAKVAGQPLELVASGADHNILITNRAVGVRSYTQPTTEGVLVVVRFKNTQTNSTATGSQSRVLDFDNGDRRCRYTGGLDDTLGKISLSSSTDSASTPATAIPQEPGTEVLLGSGEGWIAFYAPAANGYAIAERLDASGQRVTMPYSDFKSDPSDQFVAAIVSLRTSGSIDKKFEYYELFAYGVT